MAQFSIAPDAVVDMGSTVSRFKGKIKDGGDKGLIMPSLLFHQVAL
jgi:hypothetical protein